MYSVSIIIPVYNSMRTLKECVDSIIMQDYPHEQIEILFADGGSRDGTRELIENYKSWTDIDIYLIDNPLRTAEAGKAVGLRAARNDIVALIDSDNIMPNGEWLSEMMVPFSEKDILAAEPIEYTYRREDSMVTRYCSLIGMGDPMCMFVGNYDRINLISNTWTKVKCQWEDRQGYLSIQFNPKAIPTIGANGFLMRKQELLEFFEGEYLFDIDVIWELLNKNPNWRVAKVKNGIIHLFCPDVKTFIKKQKRRITDFLYFNKNGGRKYPWSEMGKEKILLFCLATVTVIPLVAQAAIGYTRKHDLGAWAFHIAACWITMVIYAIGVLKAPFQKKMMSRDDWKQ